VSLVTQPDPANPLIVHADRTVVLETFHPRSEAARVAIAPFAELERSPEHLHTYRITPLSLWNAASAGHDGPAIVNALRRYSKFPLPPSLEVDVAELTGRWGRLRMTSVDDELRLGVAEGDGVTEGVGVTVGVDVGALQKVTFPDNGRRLDGGRIVLCCLP